MRAATQGDAERRRGDHGPGPASIHSGLTWLKPPAPRGLMPSMIRTASTSCPFVIIGGCCNELWIGLISGSCRAVRAVPGIAGFLCEATRPRLYNEVGSREVFAGRGRCMLTDVRRWRCSWLALIAIATVFSSAPVVSACSTQKPSTAHCCCGAQASAGLACCAQPEPERADTPLPGGPASSPRLIATRVPCSTCFCDQSSAPARQRERRPARDGWEKPSTHFSAPHALSLPGHVGPALCLTSPISPCATRAPLYLRLEHLII